MHPNPIYRGPSERTNLGFARARGFGTLALNGTSGPLLSYIPFVLSPGGTGAEFHLMRSNPIARALRDGPAHAVLAVQGPDGYISPDWYGLDEQVPTWNYVAVHLRGTVELLDDSALPGLLDRLSDTYEERLAPKPVWKSAKMQCENLERMMRMVQPARLVAESVDGTWKLSQNKPEAARLSAADAVEGSVGQELGALARLMRKPPQS